MKTVIYIRHQKFHVYSEPDSELQVEVVDGDQLAAEGKTNSEIQSIWHEKTKGLMPQKTNGLPNSGD